MKDGAYLCQHGGKGSPAGCMAKSQALYITGQCHVSEPGLDMGAASRPALSLSPFRPGPNSGTPPNHEHEGVGWLP